MSDGLEERERGERRKGELSEWMSMDVYSSRIRLLIKKDTSLKKQRLLIPVISWLSKNKNYSLFRIVASGKMEATPSMESSVRELNATLNKRPGFKSSLTKFQRR